MTKNIIAIAITAGIAFFGASSGLRADDQKAPVSATSQCGGDGGDKAPPSPTPAPSPTN